jgi:hypothetical protein
MEGRRPTRWFRLPERWEELALHLLETRTKFTADQYQNKIIKERLLDAMATPNITALLDAGGRLDGLDAEEVAGRLALDRGTINRWIRGAVQPHARMFFGILVMGLRRGIDEVDLPGTKAIIWEAVSTTMGTIREKELGRDRRLPSREDFVLVRTLMRHADADAFVPAPDEGERPDPEICSRILPEILNASCAERPTIRRLGVEGALSSVLEWAEAYALFRTGLLWEWRPLDEDAA